MRAELERKLRNVRLRCGANLLLEQLGRVLIAAGIASALGVAVARVFGLTIPIAAAVWALGGTVVALTALLWFLKVPSRMGVALMMDERLAFHERFSTALALGGGSGRKDAAPGAHDPFAEAAIREAHQAAEGVALKGHFPLRPSRTWAFTGAAWAIAVAVILLLPTMDLLGHIRERRVQEKEAEQLAQARTDVQQATSAVKAAVDQLGDPELAKELIGLDDISGAKPADLRRQAIRKLGSLSEKLKGKQAGAKLAAGRMLEQMLRRLRGTPGGMLRELGRSLGKSDFSRAAAILREMTEKLAGEKLSDEEKAALAKQLRELGQKLRELAGQNRQLEEELEQAGLDPKLAKMSAEKLREALKKAGLSDQRIEELMQKAAACSGASNRLGQLGDAMAAAGGALSAASRRPSKRPASTNTRFASSRR